MRLGRNTFFILRSLTTSLVAASVLATLTCSLCAQALKVAPGVLRTIPAEPQEDETVSGPRELVDLAKTLPEWQPNFIPASETLRSMAKESTFRRTIWQLEFSFKPVRMMTTSDGRLIWYLVYKVTNKGGHLKPTANDTGNSLEKDDFPVRFYPVFVLEGHDHKQQYTDRIVSGGIRQIHAREIRNPRVRLHSSVEIGSRPLSVSGDGIDRGVWGVAMWENVDPRTDFFSVYVGGLSNAYEWPAEVDSVSQLKYKTLQLNFWRPGDMIREREDEIRFGMPKVSDPVKKAKLLGIYKLDDAADHVWIYK